MSAIAEPEQASVFLCNIGPLTIAVPALEVASIIDPRPATHIPCTPDYAEGVFIHHGRTTSIINLQKKYQLSKLSNDGPVTRRSLLIVNLTQDKAAAFLVDKVNELTELNDIDIQECFLSDTYKIIAVEENNILFASLKYLLNAPRNLFKDLSEDLDTSNQYRESQESSDSMGVTEPEELLETFDSKSSESIKTEAPTEDNFAKEEVALMPETLTPENDQLKKHLPILTSHLELSHSRSLKVINNSNSENHQIECDTNYSSFAQQILWHNTARNNPLHHYLKVDSQKVENKTTKNQSPKVAQIEIDSDIYEYAISLLDADTNQTDSNLTVEKEPNLDSCNKEILQSTMALDENPFAKPIKPKYNRKLLKKKLRTQQNIFIQPTNNTHYIVGFTLLLAGSYFVYNTLISDSNPAPKIINKVKMTNNEVRPNKGADNNENPALNSNIPIERKNIEDLTNNLSDTDTRMIVTAERLLYVEHTVNHGETLWGISANYFNSPYFYKNIADSNNIENPDLIHPNIVLKIKNP